MDENYIGSQPPLYATLFATAALVLGVPSASPGLRAQQPRAALAFRGATIIDVSNGQLHPDQTVVVTGTRITAVGPAGQVRVPTGARVVDASGKYLIPGLWDMHVHLWDRPDLYGLFIASGVTGIRHMGAKHPLAKIQEARQEISAGIRAGPRVIATGGYLISWSPGNMEVILVRTADAARRGVNQLQAAGADFIKSYGLPSNLYFAAAAEARRIGIPLVGHLSRDVTTIQASDSGQRSIEHLSNFHERVLGPDSSSACWPQEQGREADSAAADRDCAVIITRFIQNETWLVPTLVTAKYVLPRLSESTRKLARRLFRLGAGVRVLAGSDANREFSRIIPGAALHDELVLLVESGLAPLAALQAATLNPAKYLRATDSLGTVTAGNLADLILLDANPLESISNIMQIRAVVANGRYFDRAGLDSLNPKATQHAKDYTAAIAAYGRSPRGTWLGASLAHGPAPSGIPGIQGARVGWLPEQSNARTVGIDTGDVIITLDGRRVESSWDVDMRLALWEPGKKVSMEVVRNGVPRVVNLTTQ